MLENWPASIGNYVKEAHDGGAVSVGRPDAGRTGQ